MKYLFICILSLSFACSQTKEEKVKAETEEINQQLEEINKEIKEIENE